MRYNGAIMDLNKIPKIVRKQMHIHNSRTQNVEKYYRITIFIPLIQAIPIAIIDTFSRRDFKFIC